MKTEAIQYNQRAWELLARKDKTTAEKEELIAAAHASLQYWADSPECQPVNIQRGEYLIAVAYIHVGQKDEALAHARRCQELTAANPTAQDFDQAHAALALAFALGMNIRNDQDRHFFWEDVKLLG